MTVQFPTFRRTVALQMEGYNQRIAKRIRRERERRGEEPEDAAARAAVSVRTYERWESAESKPQLKNLNALAKSWGVGLETLRPDLEEDAEALERIEAKLDLLLTNAGLTFGQAEPDDELEQDLEGAARRSGSTGSRSGGSTRASRKS